MATKRKGTGMKGLTIKGGHKRPTKKGAGMTAKGVAAYRRKNPGSKLKTAVTEKKPSSKARAARRKSFCARSAGQMKKFPKAAKDPNSRLRQARRRWRCQMWIAFVLLCSTPAAISCEVFPKTEATFPTEESCFDEASIVANYFRSRGYLARPQCINVKTGVSL